MAYSNIRRDRQLFRLRRVDDEQDMILPTRRAPLLRLLNRHHPQNRSSLQRVR